MLFLKALIYPANSINKYLKICGREGRERGREEGGGPGKPLLLLYIDL